MVKQIKVLAGKGIILLLINHSVFGQTNNHKEEQQDTSQVQSSDVIQQQEPVTQQSVTISDTPVVKMSGTESTNYRPTEKIRIYSGRHEGNNIIKTVEVPLPGNSTGRSGDYVPHWWVKI